MEDFVPFELAVKLKEKGFDWKTELRYVRKIKGSEREIWDEESCNWVSEYSVDIYPKPTISQVLKWLREEKEIDIILQPIFLYNENNREREYGIEIYAPQLNKPTRLDYFKNWGKGAVAGIEYVLDNLI